MTGRLLVGPRYCGPPGTGNGGYVSGLIAGFLDGPAEVTLRRPPPLGTPLAVQRDGDQAIRVLDGPTLVAEAARAPDHLAVELPARSRSRTPAARAVAPGCGPTRTSIRSRAASCAGQTGNPVTGCGFMSGG